MSLVPCHFDLPIPSYGLWLKVPFCWLLKMTYNGEIDNFLWEHFLDFKCEEELYEMSFSSKWAFDGIFLIIHVEVMPWSSYSWLFQLSKYGNFCILRLFEPCLENHDQALIKWCLWLQNKMLTKNLNFWLSNDHFAPVVDCRAIRVFDCAILCCKSWDLAWGCLTMFVGLWDLIGPFETSTSLSEPKP